MKNNLDKDLKQITKKYIKVKFNLNDDLYFKGLIDSMDILNIITDIEKKYKIKLDLYKEKKFIFSIQNLSKKVKLINKKIA